MDITAYRGVVRAQYTTNQIVSGHTMTIGKADAALGMRLNLRLFYVARTTRTHATTAFQMER